MAANLGLQIFKQEAKFIAGAAEIWQLPRLYLPQVAFIGKSNVGKSSLINTLCKRKALARVSHTPGRTRQINFFSLSDKLIVVDLPGYGFAKVPKSEKQKWEKLILYYLEHSNNLRMVNLLIDARRGIKDNDIEVMKILKSFDKEFQIVFTKVDKVNLNDKFLEDNKNYLTTLGYVCNVIPTSSKSGKGAKELQLSTVQSIKK